jgi:hypothetical protein
VAARRRRPVGDCDDCGEEHKLKALTVTVDRKKVFKKRLCAPCRAFAIQRLVPPKKR